MTHNQASSNFYIPKDFAHRQSHANNSDKPPIPKTFSRDFTDPPMNMFLDYKRKARPNARGRKEVKYLTAKRSQSALQVAHQDGQFYQKDSKENEKTPSPKPEKISSETLNEDVVREMDTEGQPKDIVFLNQKVEQSTQRLMNTLKNLTSFQPVNRIKRPQPEVMNQTESVHVSLDESLMHSSVVANSANLVSEIRGHIREREDLIYSKKMLDNKAARKNYINRPVKFTKLPIDVKQDVLKGKGYNITELDSVQEVWRKTSKAIRSWNDREDQAEREAKRQELAQRNKQNNEDHNAVSYLRVINVANDFVLDDEAFQKAFQEDQEAMNEKVIKSMAVKPKRHSLHPRTPVRNSIFRNPTPPPLPEAKKVAAKKPKHKRRTSATLQRIEIEDVERECKKEIKEKEMELDKMMEAQQKYHQSLGIFSKEKNQVRLEAVKFVALYREKTKLQAKLFRNTKNTKDNTSQQHQENTDQDDCTEKSGADNTVWSRIYDALTRPIKDNPSGKQTNLKVFEKRAHDLRRRYNETSTQRSQSLNYTRLLVK